MNIPCKKYRVTEDKFCGEKYKWINLNLNKLDLWLCNKCLTKIINAKLAGEKE